MLYVNNILAQFMSIDSLEFITVIPKPDASKYEDNDIFLSFHP